MEKLNNILAAITRLTTPAQLAAARNVLSLLAGIAITAGVINTAKSQALIDTFVNIGTAVGAIAVAFGTIAGILAPLFAANSASPTNQINRVAAMAKDDNLPQQDEAKKAILKAADAIPEVEKVVAPSLSEGLAKDIQKVVSK